MVNTQNKVEALKPLTSLRFVAAMMIVVFHAKQHFQWSWLAYAPDSFVTGVSFFFVLSGFILTHVYTSRGFPGYSNFIRARFARLWPMHVFSLIVLVIVLPLNMLTANGPGVFSKWLTLLSNLTLTQALIPLRAYSFSWNSVSWSISAETAFYLAFPLLLVNIRRTWQWKLLGATSLAALMLVLVSSFNLPYDGDAFTISVHSATDTNPLVRGFEFCLGMATWVIWDRYIKHSNLSYLAWSALELLVMVIALLWTGLWFMPINDQMPNSIPRLVFDIDGSAWLFAMVIAILALGHGAIGRLLSARPLVFLGEISFSVYMLHQILMRHVDRVPSSELTKPWIFFPALLLFASGTFLLVEKPAQRFLTQRRAPQASNELLVRD